MPNRMVGDSVRDAGKPKQGEGLWKPKSEPVWNRVSEPAISGVSLFGMSCLGVGRVGSPKLFFARPLDWPSKLF
jgi:hypothetical protein